MKKTRIIRGLVTLAMTAVSATAVAEPVQIDTTDPQSGLTSIYSVTFDGPTNPCGPASPSYCSFFGSEPRPPPPTGRAISFLPNPSRVVNGVPDGIGPGFPPLPAPQEPVPPAGSFLDLTLAPGNTSVTISGGTIKFPDLPIIIRNETVINARGAGIAFDTDAPQVATLDANGVGVFLVNLAPAFAVDFSAFTVVATDCTGSLCTLIPVLNLDMIKYRMVIDYDPTFTSFTADFIGQTGNNSFVYATLNSATPTNVSVTDSVLPADDRLVAFGLVPQGQVVTETVTVTNSGAGNLLVGQIGGGNALLPPFSLVSDTCSNQSLATLASCTFGVQFEPTESGERNDTLDIPTDDPGAPVVTLSVSGGQAAIAVTDPDDPVNDLRAGFRTVLVSGTAERVITVSNGGEDDIVLGNVGQLNPLEGAFSFTADTCSGELLPPAGSCTITTSFAPGAILAYTDSFDIPYTDPEPASVTFSLSGNGGGVDNPPTADGADSGFMALDPLTLLGLGLLGVAVRRRARAARRSH